MHISALHFCNFFHVYVQLSRILCVLIVKHLLYENHFFPFLILFWPMQLPGPPIKDCGYLWDTGCFWTKLVGFLSSGSLNSPWKTSANWSEIFHAKNSLDIYLWTENWNKAAAKLLLQRFASSCLQFFFSNVSRLSDVHFRFFHALIDRSSWNLQ